jgi:hypothetical protein
VPSLSVFLSLLCFLRYAVDFRLAILTYFSFGPPFSL